MTFTMPKKTLDEFLGIRRGDKRELLHKERFGSHWEGHLDDTYKIEEIVLTSEGVNTGIVPRKLTYNPYLVNVIVTSVEDPSFKNMTIGIYHFLKANLLKGYDEPR